MGLNTLAAKLEANKAKRDECDPYEDDAFLDKTQAQPSIGAVLAAAKSLGKVKNNSVMTGGGDKGDNKVSEQSKQVNTKLEQSKELNTTKLEHPKERKSKLERQNSKAAFSQISKTGGRKTKAMSRKKTV